MRVPRFRAPDSERRAAGSIRAHVPPRVNNASTRPPSEAGPVVFSVTLTPSTMRALAVVVVLTVSGCATSHRTPAPQAVRFTINRDAVRGCTSVGVIDSSNKPNEETVEQMSVAQDRYRRLRNEAATLGANVVLLPENPTGMTSKSLVNGEAYKCPLSQG